MQIQTIRTGFKAFEWKFQSFERDWKHLNTNSKHSNEIRSIRMGFEAFESYWKYSNANSSHSKGIRSIQVQIETIRKGLETF